MPTLYRLRALTRDGQLMSFDLSADNEERARAQVSGLGHKVLSLRKRWVPTLAGSARSRPFPVLLFSHELRALLAAGIPLSETLDTLADKEQAQGTRAILLRIARTLHEGRSLSAALAQEHTSFDSLYVATLRAAERTGDLVPALERYIHYRTQMDAARKQLRQALVYPTLLLGAGALVTLFLLFYVVPRFSRIYDERNADLPIFSRLLSGWGQVIDGHGLLIAGVLSAGTLVAWRVLRNAELRANAVGLLWRVPALGEQARTHLLARLFRSTSMLLRSGASLVDALDLCAGLLHPHLRGQLRGATAEVRAGKPISTSLQRHGLTTPVALRLLGAGERGGNMGEMMDRIADFHDEEFSRRIDWFTRLLEPLLMAAIGIVIGTIVILMYMPIFELAGAMR